MKSAKQWRALLHEVGGTRPLADRILRELSGYRANAAARHDDTDSLAAALDAMLNEGRALAKREAGAGGA